MCLTLSEINTLFENIDILPIKCYNTYMNSELKNYKNVPFFADKWGLSERSVRNYCANGLISGAKIVGKTWYIPEKANVPQISRKLNKKKNYLLDRLLRIK